MSIAAGAAAPAAIVDGLSGVPGLTVSCCEPSASAVAGIAVFIVAGPAAALAPAVQQVRALRRLAPSAVVLAALDGASTAALETLLAAGAADFVSMPVDPVDLVTRLRRALGLGRCTEPADAPAVDRPAIRGLVYTSDAMAGTARRLHTMARCDANVLILGETGTGKEVCAQAVHYLSTRSAHAWVPVNSGAIPGDLVETELFGHVKGAYTTALAARSGLVHEAEGGTLFLDDIECLSLAAQAKLLRFLQEREYRPVGSNQVLRADVRVIAASNADLLGLAQRGAFRLDLYFRLNVLRLNLPPLRERREDIAVLALHFMRHFGREIRSPIGGLAPQALRRLCEHHWPGNVRELRHVMERAMLLARGPQLVASDIEIDGAAPSAEADTAADESFRSAKLRAVSDFERAYLERMLSAHRGNVTRAADASKKDRRAFFELMRKYDIQPQRFREAGPR